MRVYLIKLKFNTAVHFGDDQATPDKSLSNITMRADSFYSALLIESLKNGGEEQLRETHQIFCNGALISDLMPYYEDNYFIPKPILHFYSDPKTKKQNQETNQETNQEDQKQKDKFGKKLKSLKYININSLDDYLRQGQGGGQYNPEKDQEMLDKIGKNQTRVMMCLETVEGNRQIRLENPMPYFYGVFSFAENSGLYLLLKIDKKEDFDLIKSLIYSLGHSGIGGKVSCGLGKYEIQDCFEIAKEDKLKMFDEHLDYKKYPSFMTLSVCFPKQDELKQAHENANYMLLKRSGFVQSAKYSDTLVKKKDMYVFAPGSTFKYGFKGDIFDVSKDGNHEVYRYLKPFFIGVKYEKKQNDTRV